MVSNFDKLHFSNFDFLSNTKNASHFGLLTGVWILLFLQMTKIRVLGRALDRYNLKSQQKRQFSAIQTLKQSFFHKAPFKITENKQHFIPDRPGQLNGQPSCQPDYSVTQPTLRLTLAYRRATASLCLGQLFIFNLNFEKKEKLCDILSIL